MVPSRMETDVKKRIAALSSVIWSALLTIMKFVVGIMTGSLGILSEALHSALDMLAAGGTYYAVKVAAQPADDEHPYGHGRVENLMALAEAILLLVTAGWVIWEAHERLLSDNPEASLHVELSIWAFAVVIISIIVDVSRARMLYRVAKETRSAALEADAAHFASDIWSSAAVLVGLIGVAVADMTIKDSWLNWFLQRADVFASLIVSILILRICWTLGKAAVENLMDKADIEAAQQLQDMMKEHMPTYPLHSVRVREVGTKYHVEMVILVPREMHVDTAHEITQAIEELVDRALPGAETILHVEPAETVPDTPEFIIRRLALSHRLGIHGLVMMHSEQGFIVFADLELPKGAILERWQVPIQAFRKDVRHHLKADAVYVHLEPSLREIPAFSKTLPESTEWASMVRNAMIELGAPLPLSINTYTHGEQRFCFIIIPNEPALSVEASHKRLSQLNKRLTETLPRMARFMVTYHAD